MPATNWRTALGWTVLTSLCLVPAAAQTAPATASPPAEENDEDVVILAEWRVDASQDDGWAASNTITGTRLSTPLRDVPFPINAITSEFIADVGAVNLKEALVYEAGIVQDNVQASNNFLFSPSGTGQAGQIGSDNTTINIRGFNTRSQLRNGFRVDTINDNLNVGRLEVARGPQALLYGVAVLGGVVNILPDYPSSRPRYQTRVTVGDPDFFRAEAEASGPIVNREGLTLGYRAGLAYQDWDGDLINDGGDRERTFYSFAFDARLGSSTDLFIDLEGYTATVTGTGVTDFNDSNNSSSYERRTNRFGELTANNIYGETALVGRDFFALENGYRLTGTDTFTDEDFVSATAILTQRFGKHTSLNIGVNQQRTERSGLGIGAPSTTFTTTVPSTAEAATYSEMTGLVVDNGLVLRDYTQQGTARTFKRVNYSWNANESEVELTQFRAELAQTIEFLGNHTVLLGYQDVRWHQDQISTTQTTNNYGLESGVGSVGATAGVSSSVPFLEVPEGGIRYAGERFRPFRLNAQTEWNTGMYAIYQGRFFDDRLYLIGGLRRDRYMVRDLNYSYSLRSGGVASNYADWERPENYDNYLPGSTTAFNNPNANAGSAATGRPGEVPRVEGYRFGGETQHENSPTYGASFRVNDALSVYAVSAAGVFPNRGQRDGAGGSFEAEKTQSAEFGLKFDLWKNAQGQAVASGAMALFRVERENAIYNVFWAPQPRSNNRARVRSGWPANTFQDFEQSQRVAYLLPVSYFTPEELNDPRVQAARGGGSLGPSREVGGRILVYYDTLGPVGGTDPFRNAMERAAADPTNISALGVGVQGSGANGLTAANADTVVLTANASGLSPNFSYINRNSDVAYDDKTTGFETQLLFRPIPNWQTTFSYTYLEQEVTGGFNFVDAPGSTEYDPWWRFMGYTTDEARAINNDESQADVSAAVIGKRTLDNPDHSAALFTKYTFESNFLKGFDVGFGVNWSGTRISEAAITNGLQTREGVNPNQRFRPEFSERWVWNALFGYKRNLGKVDLTVRLNINNLFDDDEQIEVGSSTIDPDGTGPLGLTEVPTIARSYYNPRSFRLSVGLDF